MKRNYWGYRTAKSLSTFFMAELNNGRLRQGWGWDDKQDLRNFKMDEGAGRNKSMLNVKKGDILLIPHLPNYGKVAIIEATDNWKTGYKFEIHHDKGDFGHIFPAKYIKAFARSNENVSGNIRSTLKNPSRFWNINHYSADIEALVNTEESSLIKTQYINDRATNAIGEVFIELFQKESFSNKIYERFNNEFTREEWEFVLVDGLRKLFPFYEVTREGGINEKNHGTDILIKLPGISNQYRYAIAIQVKDYEGCVDSIVIKQIKKADNYWKKQNLVLIDKWLVITKSEKHMNKVLEENCLDVKIMFAEELKELLDRIAKKQLSNDFIDL